MDLLKQDWVSEAAILAERIRAAAVVRGNEWSWRDPRRKKPTPLAPHLHSGTAGIALFFAALHRCQVGPESSAEISLRALLRLRHQLKRMTSDPSLVAGRKLMIGGLVGLGGYIYALAQIGRWLEIPELLTEASKTVDLITPERISNDQDLDVAHGSAGAILALLALEKIAPEPASAASALETACSCGEHLLSQTTSPGAWPANKKTPRCGFAHGATGIAVALARLGVRTGRKEFLDAAEDGLRFERSLYDLAQQVWRTTAEGKNLDTTWCNGTVGMILGRLVLRELVDFPEIDGEIDAALAGLQAAEPVDIDIICCGNLGRAEAYEEAARRRNNVALIPIAQEIARRAFERTRRHDGNLLLNDATGERSFDPSFFIGAAGAGYTALRMAFPGQLECPLVFDLNLDTTSATHQTHELSTSVEATP